MLVTMDEIHIALRASALRNSPERQRRANGDGRKNVPRPSSIVPRITLLFLLSYSSPNYTHFPLIQISRLKEWILSHVQKAAHAR